MFQPDPLASAATGKESHWARECTHAQDAVHRAGGVKQAAGSWRRECKGQQIWEGGFYAKKQHWESSCHSSTSQSWMKPCSPSFKLYSSKDPRQVRHR